MKRFKQYIVEGKNISDLYHFTYIPILKEIIKDYKLKSGSKDEKTGKYTISFTRAFNYPDITKLGNQNVRITVDGSKLSNNYKIDPFKEFDKKEAEERIFTKELPLKKYIKQIDILDKGKNISDIVNQLKKDNINVNLVSKFKR
jgi:hypothetical protein